MADGKRSSAPQRGQDAGPPGDRALASPHVQPSANSHRAPRRGLQRLLGRQPEHKPTAHGADSSAREVIETVVFVVVLVLLLKTFVAEAFVIPTGSMATTLWGDQKYARCPKCDYGFPVNCHDEVEGREGGEPVPVTGCTCPNCFYSFDFAPPSEGGPTCNSGDRVLVAKYLYDTGIQKPHRLDVVVFKFPKMPQKNESPTNYIKRLIGLPGETIGIYYGKLYVMPPGRGHDQAPEDQEIPPTERWNRDRYPRVMHENQDSERLKQGDPSFEIVRKPPDKILAMRRIVYDNDHPARDLDEPRLARWQPGEEGAWRPVEGRAFRHDGPGMDWLRYRHLLRPEAGDPDASPAPELITDFIGYNSRSTRPHDHPLLPRNWVGDLILECEVEVSQASGRLVLELSKGVDQFRADWDLASGGCRLVRITGKAETDLGHGDSALNKPGTYRLRFANVDERLVVWVNGRTIFGDGVPYPAPSARGPTENDLRPASIGAAGNSVIVRRLQLWRDTYYTNHPPQADVSSSGIRWSDPSTWGPLRDLPARTLYVQPEPRHYLCLGDNSPESSDGREWGLVPERLLLGRALLVYWPCYLPYWPVLSPVNRVGPIR